MSDTVHGFVRHLGVRLRAVLTDPESALLLIGFGLAAAVTPTLVVGRNGTGVEAGFDLLGLVGWLWGWPAVPALVAAGRSTAGPGGTPFSTRALPALPVGQRTRVVAELVVAVLVTTVAWLPLQLVLEHGQLAATLGTVLSAVLATAPTLAAWTLPSRSPGMTMARPFVVALGLGGATLLGWFETLPAQLLVSSVLISAVLAIGDREPIWRLPRWPARAARRSRPGLEPEQRLMRDAWEQPLRLFGPWTAVSTVVLAVAFALELGGRLHALGLIVSAELVLVPLLIASLRPFGSELVGMALTGKHGGRRGDFLRAVSVLPLRPSTVLRTVWLQALLLMAAVWLTVVALFALHAWLHTGRLALGRGDGDSLARLLLGFAAIIPCHAGLVLSAAVGDRVRLILGGFSWLAVMNGGPVLLYLAQRLGQGDAGTSIALQTTVLAGLTLLGGLPPLVHLRRTPVHRGPVP